MTAQEGLLSMQRTYSNRWFDKVPTHYIIWSDGSFVKVNWLDVIVWATLNYDANANGIHIEMVGDSNVNYHTPKQYETLRTLIGWIKQKYPKSELKYRKDFLQTTPETWKQRYKNCPGKNFDYDFMNKKTITFHLSRYYSPEPNQKRYLSDKTWYISEKYTNDYIRMWYKQWYEWDVCMNCWCSLEGEKKLYDCTVPADWQKLRPEWAWTVIACPKEYKLGTMFYLDDIGVTICRDRGWAIVGNRLDIWLWYWDTALDSRNNKYTGKKQWYVLSQ